MDEDSNEVTSWLDEMERARLRMKRQIEYAQKVRENYGNP